MPHVSWTEMHDRYIYKKYRGRRGDHQLTLTVEDVTLGGDLLVRNYRYGESTWTQKQFLEFLKTAKEIPV